MSTDTTRLIRDGGGGERERVSSSTEETVDHRQNNNYVTAVGTSPVRSN